MCWNSPLHCSWWSFQNRHWQCCPLCTKNFGPYSHWKSAAQLQLLLLCDSRGKSLCTETSRPHRFLTHYKGSTSPALFDRWDHNYGYVFSSAAPEPPFSPQVERLPNGDVMVLLSPASSEYGPIRFAIFILDCSTDTTGLSAWSYMRFVWSMPVQWLQVTVPCSGQ